MCVHEQKGGEKEKKTSVWEHLAHLCARYIQRNGCCCHTQSVCCLFLFFLLQQWLMTLFCAITPSAMERRHTCTTRNGKLWMESAYHFGHRAQALQSVHASEHSSVYIYNKQHMKASSFLQPCDSIKYCIRFFFVLFFSLFRFIFRRRREMSTHTHRAM